jgi:transposase InsO family protein
VLSASAFLVWTQRLGLSAEAVQEITLIRTTPPRRLVRSGAGNVPCRFPSAKMGRVLQAESHTVELPFIVAAERDADVLELWDQPRQGWSMPLRYLARSGHPVVAPHTPDFFALRQESAGWVECKPHQRLVTLAATQPNRYRLGEDGRWTCPPGEAYAAALGLTYRVFSSAEINWRQQRNWAFLADYLVDARPTVDATALARVRAVIEDEPGIRLARLRERLKGLVDVDDLHVLIATGRIYVDLDAHVLTEPDTVPVFRDPEMAAAHAALTLPAASVAVPAPALVRVEEGERVEWDGRPWTIGPVTEAQTTLISAQGVPVQLRSAVLAEYVRSGRIVGGEAPRPVGLTAEGRARLAQASPADQARANRRYAILRPHLEDGVPLAACPGDVGRSTKFAWAKLWREAEQQFGHGYLGLLDHHPPTRRRRVLSEELERLLRTTLEEHYATYRHKRKRRAYGAFLVACERAGLPAISERTFYTEAGRYLTAHAEQLKRAGPRAARALQPPADAPTLLVPRHGERPWQLAHLDHTEVDLELLSARTGRPLGRPWLTLLSDAFTRRVLALYLTFAKPSYVSAMMALRLCVQRWGRLPDALVVDGGPEFHSTYFETLLAWYRVTLKTRPPGEPTYGSIGERLFGTANSTFLHTLLGNTQVTQRVRQVTPAVDPRRHACWTLGDLTTWLGAWAFEVYDTIDHPALGQSPREAHARAEGEGGARAHVRIPYDEDFLIRTLPTTRKGTARVQPGHGVKIHNILYWCSAFDDPEVEGTSLAVRYDPFDVGTAYAYLPKARRWVTCRSDYFALLHGRSEREIQLVGAELRKELRDHRAGDKVTAKRLAEFSARAEAHEEILRQRERDAETRGVLTLLRGDADPPSTPPAEAEESFPVTPLIARPAEPRPPKLLPRLP